MQEYFFEDWRRIQQVFNDIDQPRELQIIESIDMPKSAGMGQDSGKRFRVNSSISPAAVQKIYT